MKFVVAVKVYAVWMGKVGRGRGTNVPGVKLLATTVVVGARVVGWALVTVVWTGFTKVGATVLTGAGDKVVVVVGASTTLVTVLDRYGFPTKAPGWTNPAPKPGPNYEAKTGLWKLGTAVW